MAALGSGQCSFSAGKDFCCLEDGGLLVSAGLEEAFVVELGQDGAHAVEAKSACMVGRGDELTADGVHLCQGANLSRVAEIVGIDAAGEARARGWLGSYYLIVGLSSEHFSEEGRGESAQVAASAGASDEDVGLDAILLERSLHFEADDRLMQKHLIQDAAQLVAIAFVGNSHLDCFGDGTAERTRCTRELSQYLAANLGRVAGRGNDAGTIGADDFTAERLLLVRALHHEDLEVEAEVLASHAERRAPLACTRLGGNAFQPLLLGIVGLSNRRVQLVRAARVVAFELIEYLGRRVERLFQELRVDEWAGTEHAVKADHLVGDVEPLGVVVELLRYEFFTEDGLHLSRREGLSCAWIQQRCRLYLHVSTHIVPFGGHLFLTQIDLVRDVFHTLL